MNWIASCCYLAQRNFARWMIISKAKNDECCCHAITINSERTTGYQTSKKSKTSILHFWASVWPERYVLFSVIKYTLKKCFLVPGHLVDYFFPRRRFIKTRPDRHFWRLIRRGQDWDNISFFCYYLCLCRIVFIYQKDTRRLGFSLLQPLSLCLRGSTTRTSSLLWTIFSRMGECLPCFEFREDILVFLKEKSSFPEKDLRWPFDWPYLITRDEPYWTVSSEERSAPIAFSCQKDIITVDASLTWKASFNVRNTNWVKRVTSDLCL